MEEYLRMIFLARILGFLYLLAVHVLWPLFAAICLPTMNIFWLPPLSSSIFSLSFVCPLFLFFMAFADWLGIYFLKVLPLFSLSIFLPSPISGQHFFGLQRSSFVYPYIYLLCLRRLAGNVYWPACALPLFTCSFIMAFADWLGINFGLRFAYQLFKILNSINFTFLKYILLIFLFILLIYLLFFNIYYFINYLNILFFFFLFNFH